MTIIGRWKQSFSTKDYDKGRWSTSEANQEYIFDFGNDGKVSLNINIYNSHVGTFQGTYTFDGEVLVIKPVEQVKFPVSGRFQVMKVVKGNNGHPSEIWLKKSDGMGYRLTKLGK